MDLTANIQNNSWKLEVKLETIVELRAYQDSLKKFALCSLFALSSLSMTIPLITSLVVEVNNDSNNINNLFENIAGMVIVFYILIKTIKNRSSEQRKELYNHAIESWKEITHNTEPKILQTFRYDIHFLIQYTAGMGSGISFTSRIINLGLIACYYINSRQTLKIRENVTEGIVDSSQ